MIPSALNRTLLAAACLASSGSLSFAATATTDPVGFFTKTLAASSGSSRVSSAVSFPLYRPPVFSAAVTSVTDGSPASTCQLNGFNAATTDVLSNPHLVRVKSATNASHIGRFFLVTAAAGDQLTLNTATLSASLSIGDNCEVLPANTLASLFGTPPPTGWLSGASATTADNVFIWDGLTWQTYFYHSTNNRWQRSGALGSQNGTIIYPDEGVFVSRLGTSSVSILTTGTVPTTTEVSNLDPAAGTFIANRFPVDMLLVDVGLHLTSGWVSNTSATSADTVLIWNVANATWDTYFYHSTNNRWQKSGALGSQDSAVIPAGTAMFVKRIGGSGISTLTQSVPYTP